MNRLIIKQPLLIAFIFLLIRLVFIFQNDLLAEEAYYWNYAQHLDLGYLDHPPMIAVLIKLGTVLFGNKEWAVRFMTIPCWFIAALFSYRLSELVQKGTGKYAILLLAFLPFYFIYSIIITPDVPLIACWSAALFYLYNAIILEKNSSWYWAGLWIGLGLLSKYTIILLGPITLIYLVLSPQSRHWLLSREPYLCALIALICFLPVLYWNATHEWISFVFQGARRFQASYTFTFPEFALWVIVFFTPSGLFAAWFLLKKSGSPVLNFLKFYTFLPLLFFGLFSLFHEVRFNWIGPILLAVIPWFTFNLLENKKLGWLSASKAWAVTVFALFGIYSAIFFCVFEGKPPLVNRVLFAKLIAWEQFTTMIHQIASNAEQKYQSHLIIIPLDTYNIASELDFYQHQLKDKNKIKRTFPVYGADLFGLNSLMYRLWTPLDVFDEAIVLLISRDRYPFDNPMISQKTQPLTPVKTLVADNQAHNAKVLKFYYQLVKMNKT